MGAILMFYCIISHLQLFISDTAMMMMMTMIMIMLMMVVFAMQPDMVRVHIFSPYAGLLCLLFIQ